MGQGSSISDLFYPANPDRTKRAQQLSDDITDLITRFNEEKSSLSTLEADVQARMDDYLKSHGYDSLEALSEHVEGILEGDTLAHWRSLRDSFDGRLDSGHAVGQWALTITGLVASTSGMISTGLLLLGLVSNPVGWAIAAVTGVALVLEIFDFGIIEGAREREELREAINGLAFQRVDAKMQVNRAMVLHDWMGNFRIWFSDDMMKIDPNVFEDHFTQSFKEAMAKVDRAAAINWLRDLDQEHGAWTDEDPNVDQPLTTTALAEGPAVARGTPPPITTIKISGNKELQDHVMKFQLADMSTVRDGEITDVETGERWEIHAKPDDPSAKVASLAQVAFLLLNRKSGQQYDGCRFTIVAPPAST